MADNSGNAQSCWCSYNRGQKLKKTENCWVWRSYSSDYEEYIFWYIWPCSLLDIHQCSRGIYHLRLQGQRDIQYNLDNPAMRQSNTSSKLASWARQASTTSCSFLQATEANTDLFKPSLVYGVSVFQYYTFLYTTFHTAVDLMCAKDVQFWQL
jgi:hypothetical protein